MPFINRIRLVNVHFNQADSFFEDFRLNLNQNSTVYQLINGGGKSVLIMMILQTVLPNKPLKSEKPVKAIFSGGSNRTSHALVEWGLEEGNHHKYLLTGFCARPAEKQEGDVENSGMRYFNYTIKYDVENKNDINGLPLFEIKEKLRSVISYAELKKYLTDLSKVIPVDIYENRNMDYRDDLAQYQLVHTEWDMLRMVNEKENNLASFFRQQKGSKTLIENFLVGIIDSVTSNKDKVKGIEMAEMLTDIKESIKKLHSLHENLDEIKAYQDGIQRLIDLNTDYINELVNLEDVAEEMMAFLDYLKKEIEIKEKHIGESVIELENEKKNIYEISKKNKNITVQGYAIMKQQAEVKLSESEAKVKLQQDEIANFEKESKYMSAVNKFINYKEEKGVLYKYQSQKDKLNQGDEEINKLRRYYGLRYYLLLTRQLDSLNQDILRIEKELNTDVNEKKAITEDIRILNQELGATKGRIGYLKQAIGSSEIEYNSICSILENKGIQIFLPIEIAELIEKKEQILKNIEKEIADSEIKKNELNGLSVLAESNLQLLDKDLQQREALLAQYQSTNKSYSLAKEEIEQLLSTYGASHSHELKKNLNSFIEENTTKRLKNEEIKNRIVRDLEIIDKYGFYAEDQRLIDIKEWLEKSYAKVILGSEYLKDLKVEDRKTKLASYPLLPYSLLLLEQDFNKLKRNRDKLSQFVGAFVPIVNYESIRQDESIESGNVLFPIRDESSILELLNDVEKTKNELNQKLENIRIQMRTAEEENETYKKYVLSIEKYETLYPEPTISKMFLDIERVTNEINSINKEMDLKSKEKVTLSESINSLKIHLSQLEKSKEQEKSLLEFLEKLKKQDDTVSQSQSEVDKKEIELRLLSENLSMKNETLEIVEKNIETKRNQNRERSKNVEFKKKMLENLFEFKNEQVSEGINESFEEVKEKFENYDNKHLKSNQGLSELNDLIERTNNRIADLNKEINDLGHSVIEFEDEASLVRFDNDTIRKSKALIDNRSILLEVLKEERDGANKAFIEMNLTYENSVKEYKGLYGQFEVVQFVENLAQANKIIPQLELQYRDSEQRINKIKQSITNIEEDKQRYLEEKIKLQSFVDAKSIKVETNKNKEFKRVYTVAELESKYKKNEASCKSACALVEEERKKIIRRSKNFKAYQFGEIVESLELGISSIEAKKTTVNLNSFLNRLEETKNKVTYDYENLKGSQLQYVDKCIDMGLIIHRHLMKINLLSKINIPGLGSENMVKIELPLITSEELRRENMTQYIDRLIERMDTDKLTKEDLAKELSSKAFLSQVADMKKSQVFLFKVEENISSSRPLHWENAVESDGQTTMLYCMFLATIISFVRNLSKGTNALEIEDNSKKVIILDNPFGTTSAVYLWDVINTMLKTNNFQLIASGHDVGSAVIPYFDTNYLLVKEKMSNKSEKVVVDFNATSDGRKLKNESIISQSGLFDEI